MFHSPARNDNATARPVKISGVVSCNFGFFVCTGSGFKDDTGCGVAAEYDACNWAVVTCSQSKSTKTQACH